MNRLTNQIRIIPENHDHRPEQFSIGLTQPFQRVHKVDPRMG